MYAFLQDSKFNAQIGEYIRKMHVALRMRLGRKHIKLNENSGWRIWGRGTCFFKILPVTLSNLLTGEC